MKTELTQKLSERIGSIPVDTVDVRDGGVHSARGGPKRRQRIHAGSPVAVQPMEGHIAKRQKAPRRPMWHALQVGHERRDGVYVANVPFRHDGRVDNASEEIRDMGSPVRV